MEPFFQFTFHEKTGNVVWSGWKGKLICKYNKKSVFRFLLKKEFEIRRENYLEKIKICCYNNTTSKYQLVGSYKKHN